jgi:hypothetical protein
MSKSIEELRRIWGRMGGLALTTVAIAVGTAAGCGSSDSSTEDVDSGTDGTGGGGATGIDAADPDAALEEISSDQICPSFIALACRAVFECAELDEFVEYREEEHCRADLPCRGLANFEAEIEQGFLVYDAKDAADCRNALDDDLCAAAAAVFSLSLQGVLASCPQPPQGTRALGQSCYDTLDCQGDAFCDRSNTCPGVCSEALPEGAECAGDDRECAGDLKCVVTTCTTPIATGQSCPASGWCEEGSVCREAYDGTFELTCHALGDVGTPCGGNNHCLPGLVCPVLDTGSSATCSTPIAEGNSCRFSSQCAAGLACVADVCASEPTLGEVCDSFLFGGHDCASGFICDAEVCKAARFPGQSCGGDLETCAEGLCVDGICVPRKENDAACETSNECRFRSCEAGVCSDPASCN